MNHSSKVALKYLFRCLVLPTFSLNKMNKYRHLIQLTYQSHSRFSSYEDMSSSGTVVRSQSDESETPRSSRSRLGIQEKASSASLEDSAINLAEVMHIFHCQFLLVFNGQHYSY
jgi:hypothetical protein